MNVYKSHHKLQEYPVQVEIGNTKQWALKGKYNERLRAVLHEQHKA